MPSLNSLASGSWEPDVYTDSDWPPVDPCEECTQASCKGCWWEDIHQSPAEQLGLVPVVDEGEPIEEDELPF